MHKVQWIESLGEKTEPYSAKIVKGSKASIES